MSLDRDTLAATIASHGTVVRVVVAATAGSAPREAGAAMLVWADGQGGTIGGGALEHDATARARALIETARARALIAAPGAWQRQTLRVPLGPALGQCCGGAVTLLLEAFTAAELTAIPQTGAFARPVAPGAAPDTSQPLAVAGAVRALRSGASHTPFFGAGWMVEPLIGAARPLWLHGAGHVGRAIVRTLHGLPFAVTWIDDARARFPDTIPPHVDMLVATDPAQAVRHAPDDAHHLVMTYSHALDLAICHAVLSRRFGSLGLIGSATKKARFLARLRALGHSDATVSRLICPIGNPALGKHPAAIAVGVVHALLAGDAAVAARRTREGSVA